MLKDKVILVVGGSTGIGRATAIACGRAGATVVVGARDRAKAEAVAGQAARAGAPRTLGLPVDVRTSDAVDAFVSTAADTFGRLDGAVNNAGIEGRMAPMHDLTDADYADIMDVNARGRAGRPVDLFRVETCRLGADPFGGGRECRARNPHQHDRARGHRNSNASSRAAGQ